MKRIFFSCSLLAAMLLMAFSFLNKTGIAGTVTDGAGPVTGAAVTALQHGLQKATTVTDAAGHYELAQLQAGTYTVQVSYGGQRRQVANVRVVNNKLATVNVQLNTMPALKDEVVTRRDKAKSVATGKVTEWEAQDMARPASPAPASYMSPDYGLSVGGGRASGTMYYLNPSTESYKHDAENDFRSVAASPLSTLSIDVDRASYANVRRYLNEGQKPPADAVRVEEMVNYFDYNYPQPKGSEPVSISTELTMCPWNPSHQLLHIGLQGRRMNTDKLPATNLVFLIDVSGSMDEPNKLPLVKSAMKLLVDNLRPQDRVAIVTYAGNAGLALPSTPGSDKAKIKDALENLEAGGSTAGGEGIELAYKIAAENFQRGGNNRVILATDGDFNVGISNDNDLEKFIVQKRDMGIFLTVLGFGTGNYKDDKMELLADKGNGNHAYIDNIQEAQKTLVSEFGGTLFTIAKDVKAQVEFNPALVQGYRLVGYENRLLNAEDFKDDKKDAGELGSGHSVTILYEIIPAGIKDTAMRSAEPLKYQHNATATYNRAADELATVKFRYKEPDGAVSKELVHPIANEAEPIVASSDNLRFSASVALFGMLLKDSKYKATGDYQTVLALAELARGSDKEGYRAEFIRLVKAAR